MPASEPGRNHIMVPVLELRDISKGYADGRGVRTEVLKSINLSVGSGEFVAILGFSGTGKTTLISLMAGLINADSGEIVVNGRPSAGSGSDRGLVFQSYRSEEHTSELQSLMRISYAVFCLNKKTKLNTQDSRDRSRKQK